jgi:hypothetical protein
VAGAGLALILDASVKETTGVFLLGLACTWLLASLSHHTLRLLVSGILSVTGLSIAIVPVAADWNSFRSSVSDYDSAITDLRQAIADAAFDSPSASGKSRDPVNETPVEHGPWEKYKSIESKAEKGPWEKYSNRQEEKPKFDANAPSSPEESPPTRTVQIPESTRKWGRGEFSHFMVAKTFPAKLPSEDIFKSFQTNELRPRPAFSLWNAVKSRQESSFGGATLAVCGLIGCIWTVRRGRERTFPIDTKT